jgi:RNA polymerase sigma factor (TIGR02999 family)
MLISLLGALEHQEGIILFTKALRKNSAETVMQRPTDAKHAEKQALDHLFSVTYEELRRLASSVKRTDASNTLNPTALVNEAWLKLVKSPPFETTSRLHFKRIAARAMRQVLIEAARRRNAGKRAGQIVFTDIDLAGVVAPFGGGELLALEEALQELEQLEPRQAMLVESRFFGGLDVMETAELLEVSEATVHREWRAAKAWLKVRLRQAG